MSAEERDEREGVGTHDMAVALCDRMVVAILRERQRHKSGCAADGFPPGAPPGETRMLRFPPRRPSRG